MREPLIIGWGHTPFGKHTELGPEDLIHDAATSAIEHAGLDPSDIDGVFVGTLNSGFLPQEFGASLVSLALPQLRHTPATRLENACATGSAAIWGALDALMSGRLKRVLVVGFEKMTALPSAQVGNVLLKCSFAKEEAQTEGGFAGIFGVIASEYFDRFGSQYDALAAIAAKNHRNGVDNPYAHMRKDLGFDFCRHPSEKNPFVAGPLKRSDCSLISDGAAALVISTEATTNAKSRPVRWRSRAQVNDFLPLSKRDCIRFEGAAQAWSTALHAGSVTLDDLDVVELHDCFTIAELIGYEAMGLAQHGRGGDAILEGLTRKDGRLPVNPSGGLKSRGHPIGATGVSMHAMMAMQLTGQAGAMQVPNASLGAVFNMGGTSVANYVSIMEAA
ncbi:thiolase domain-containing protein [Candidimonas sp. SYP-B2681]|uniref:acetyl-CoA acetyltransferase n=1 Tax=Candidimonas sp. SYP-B2681 TaxID=2497686 RepID=UPI000F87B332|nr:acetyl-CoA acetyltransferase [Candidimonas sp. SYP-B2681]RTZ48219.1 thiolase domain-containing protein [Candidimonas sp. SYP-B2681]